MPNTKQPEEPSSATRWRNQIEAAREGCRASRNALIAAVRPVLVRLADQELAGEIRQFAPPSDIAQDVLAKANAGLEHFRGSTRAELLSWLKRILRNQIADEVRRHRLPSVAQSRVRERMDAAPTASQGVIAHEDRHRIEQALDRLPSHYEQAIRLRYQLELSYQEMGDVLGCSEEAARKLWTRAIKCLGRELKNG